jgi:phosphate acetyltransferase
MNELKDKINGHKIPIVFPEGPDERIVKAVNRLAEESLIHPILIGPVNGTAHPKVEVIDMDTYPETESMLRAFMERRKGKHTEDEARALLKQANYFGTMLVYQGLAQGLVSGAIQSTGDTVRPALQIIKTKPGIQRAFGYFLMLRGDEKYLMADCAINPNPSAEELAQFAVETGKIAPMYNINPKVGMLSFSTNGSGVTEESIKVKKATDLAKAEAPEMAIDGEMQFDSAFVPSVAAKKFPASTVAGQVNVFVFPTLDAGNIGYKIAQRMGQFEAIGPILAGLNKPVNDLSRGCDVDDVYHLAIITAAQTMN